MAATKKHAYVLAISYACIPSDSQKIHNSSRVWRTKVHVAWKAGIFNDSCNVASRSAIHTDRQLKATVTRRVESYCTNVSHQQLATTTCRHITKHSHAAAVTIHGGRQRPEPWNKLFQTLPKNPRTCFVYKCTDIRSPNSYFTIMCTCRYMCVVKYVHI